MLLDLDPHRQLLPQLLVLTMEIIILIMPLPQLLVLIIMVTELHVATPMLQQKIQTVASVVERIVCLLITARTGPTPAHC